MLNGQGCPGGSAAAGLRLKREIQAIALARIEDAARTPEDFANVVEWWDRLDRNRERKERRHEVARSGGGLPLDSGAAEDGAVLPFAAGSSIWRQVLNGDFIEAIFNCPYEIHELVEDADISRILRDLSELDKELLFLSCVRRLRTVQIAAVRGQTDRNIRKVRATLLERIRNQLGIE